MMSSPNSQPLKTSPIVKAPYVTLLDKHLLISDNPEAFDQDTLRKDSVAEILDLDEEVRIAKINIARELEGAHLMRDQIIAEGQKDAQNLTNQARAESSKLVMEAITRADKERDRIHGEAYAAGFDEGMIAGKEEGERLLAEAEEVLAEAKRTRQEMIDNLESELVDLTVSVAEKLVYKAAEFNPGLVLALIRAGLSESISAGSHDEISVMVSDADYPLVNESKDELLKVVGGGVKLEIIRDPSLNKSDCVIKTPFGYIDTSLGQSLENLRENLYFIAAEKN